MALVSAAAMTCLVEIKKKHVFSRKSGPRRVGKRIKNTIDSIMRKIFQNYKNILWKHSNQLTFCTKRQTSCFDIADNTATVGIYGERLPEVGKQALTLENCFCDLSLRWNIAFIINWFMIIMIIIIIINLKKCLVLKVQCHSSPVKPASSTFATSSQTTPKGDCFSFLYSEN